MALSFGVEYDAEQHLPEELLETLFHHFSGTTIGRAQAVCRKWNAILIALTHRTDIWFRRCQEEIPKYTLMQMCNHPVARQCRTREEWKDTYVRWRNYRGRMLLGRAELEPQMVISTASWGFADFRPCFTDDVAFCHDQYMNLEASHFHSLASVKKKLHSNPCNARKLLTLGIAVALNAEGKTTFEAHVEKSVLVFVYDDQFEILVGLEPKLSVQFPSLSRVGAVSTWFDTILVETDAADGHRLQVYRVHLPTDGENKEVSVDHVQSLCLNTPSSGHSDTTITYDLLLTGNKALMLVEGTHLMIFDIDKGEECRSLSLNTGTKHQSSHLPLMSWVGRTVAVTECRNTDEDDDIDVGELIIILYFLDEECERLLSITRLDIYDNINAFSLLYDDSIIMINRHGCDVLCFTRGDEDADNWSRDRECSPVVVQEAKGHIEQTEQEGDYMNVSLVSKSRDATCDSVDEAITYKNTMSNLLDINLGDPLWKNFDAEIKNACQLSNKENEGDCRGSHCEDQDNDREGSCSDLDDQEDDGAWTDHEVYIIERWKGKCTDHALSQLVRGSVINKPIPSVPHRGYETTCWKYSFTSSSVFIETTNCEFNDRLYVYKWNYMK